MVRYVGLDVHKRFIEVCILDGQGRVLFRGRVDCERVALERFARQRLRNSDRIALEATTNTWSVVEVLRPYVAAVVVSNPLKTKAIAEAKIKTDKVDAAILANLLRCEYLPDVWQPDDQTQILRSLITHRTGLGAQRGRHKNRIQSLLGRLLIYPPCKILWTKTGMAWLDRVELPADERLVLASEIRQLQQVEQEINLLDKRLIDIAGDDPRVRLLMTLPGVSHVVAIGLLAALGDTQRFRDGSHAASYLGLVPMTRQSGKRCYHGQITKAGNAQTRWLLTQACQHVSRHEGPLGAFYRRLIKRKKRQVAIMALARKLVTIAYLMLKNNEPYRYADPRLIADKFTALNRATNESSANRRGRRASLRARVRQGLAAVYDGAQLPSVTPPANLAPGEQRVLKEQNLEEYVNNLYSPPATSRARIKNTERKEGDRPVRRSR